MSSRWLLITLVAGIALLAVAITTGSRVANAATAPTIMTSTQASAATSSTVITASAKIHHPALQAKVTYVTFPAELGPYCVAAQKTNGQMIIFNGASTVSWRYNYAVSGYDRLSINSGKWIAVNPYGIHKLAMEPCLFIP